MNKYTKISNFLWDFMKDNRYRCCNTYGDTNQITCSNNQSIDKIVYHISDQIHICKGMFMVLGNRHMTMISTNNFFCNESKYNTSQHTYRRNPCPSRCMHHFGKQMKKYITKQSSCRKTHKENQYFFEDRSMYPQSKDTNQSNQTNNKHTNQCIQQLHDKKFI